MLGIVGAKSREREGGQGMKKWKGEQTALLNRVDRVCLTEKVTS